MLEAGAPTIKNGHTRTYYLSPSRNKYAEGAVVGKFRGYLQQRGPRGGYQQPCAFMASWEITLPQDEADRFAAMAIEKKEFRGLRHWKDGNQGDFFAKVGQLTEPMRALFPTASAAVEKFAAGVKAQIDQAYLDLPGEDAFFLEHVAGGAAAGVFQSGGPGAMAVPMPVVDAGRVWDAADERIKRLFMGGFVNKELCGCCGRTVVVASPRYSRLDPLQIAICPSCAARRRGGETLVITLGTP